MSTPQTPIARLAAFTKVAQHRGHDLVDSIPNATRDGRCELRVADLAAVLDALADACEGTERCARCGTVSCDQCGLGEPLTDCDPPHCHAGWCLCDACKDAHRIDQAYDADRDEAVCP